MIFAQPPDLRASCSAADGNSMAVTSRARPGK